MMQLRTLNPFQIFKTEIKKSKTCSGCCPFLCLSNGSTLMKIQSGQTIPSKPDRREERAVTVAEFIDPVRELKSALKVELKLALTTIQDL
jgi:hypothetical protein